MSGPHDHLTDRELGRQLLLLCLELERRPEAARERAPFPMADLLATVAA